MQHLPQAYHPHIFQSGPMTDNAIIADDSIHLQGEDDDDNDSKPDKRSGRRKIKIEYIQDKSRRHITFSKRKAGIMKKAYELSTLTGTQVLLLVVSETGLVYTFTTPKLQPLVTKPEGKNLIQACLNAPDTTSPAESNPHPQTASSSPTTSPTQDVSLKQQHDLYNSSTLPPQPNMPPSSNAYQQDRKIPLSQQPSYHPPSYASYQDQSNYGPPPSPYPTSYAHHPSYNLPPNQPNY
ncbi:SRF-TF-domain-containing protein [Hesseltinella vesiculosa]|uniref:SRF-TF-domain-containing protein n=1 Tax=Hesseltinella vesiculosa TaxID=101127 RepID=A0A1X2GAM6_9FUNG|nr:SRF-TF-domain-containing protein [Hesseltinella vesiculosa]